MSELDASLAVQVATGEDDTGNPWHPRLHRVAARWLHRSSAGTMPTTGPLVLDLGVPNVGRWWEVMDIVVVSTDAHTSVSSSSWALFAGSLPLSGEPNLSACVWPATSDTVPSAETFSRRQIGVMPGEHLMVVVYGASENTSLMANMLGWDRDQYELVDFSVIPDENNDGK